MKTIKRALMALAAGAMTLQFGGGCLDGNTIGRLLGDAVGDTLAYNIFLD